MIPRPQPPRSIIRPAWSRLITSALIVFSMLWLLAVPTVSPVAASSSPQEAGVSDPAPLDMMTYEELQAEKLRQEIVQLQQANRRGFGASLRVYAPFLTALAALFGILITLWKQITESSRQKELDREQRKAERKEQIMERKRRTDEQFNKVATCLGSDSEPIQASAAVSMVTFSRPEYKEYYAQAFLLMLANLKIDHSPAIQSLLINSFEQIARKYLPRKDDPPLEETLDFSHATLTGADLSRRNLTGADLGYAGLRRANLSDTCLRNVRGYKAQCDKARFSDADLQAARLHEASFRECQFHNARLIDVKMRGANLEGAQFHQAKLQGAHFEETKCRRKTNLKNARFNQADLNDAYFNGAEFSSQTLRSIVKAKNWKKAHFDDAIRKELNELAKEGKP